MPKKTQAAKTKSEMKNTGSSSSESLPPESSSVLASPVAGTPLTFDQKAEKVATLCIESMLDSALVQGTLGDLAEQLHYSSPLKDSWVQRMRELFLKCLTDADTQRAIKSSLKETLYEEETDQLYEFYTSPIFQTIKTKMPLLSEKVSSLTKNVFDSPACSEELEALGIEISKEMMEERAKVAKDKLSAITGYIHLLDPHQPFPIPAFSLGGTSSSSMTPAFNASIRSEGTQSTSAASSSASVDADKQRPRSPSPSAS